MPAETTGANLWTTSFSVGNDRNYSMLYDKSTYTAYWVAYPLIASYMGSGYSGTWKKNPDIAASQQIDVWSGSYGVTSGTDSYSRGHQLPNADRNGTSEMLSQAYYATNSTPQLQNGFNGGIWNALENSVRGAVQSSDTLYVVTGAILRTKGGNETIKYISPKYDTKQCPVPNYYYKVLLKCKRDNKGAITSAATIGVWFEHKTYSNSSWTNYVTSVAEIERLTGYDFFANLPADIAAVAEQNNNWTTFKNF